MLLRFSLSAAGALLLAAGASAQSDAKFMPVPGVKNAGTYHVATGTWTRGTPSVATSYQTIYDNTCAGAWYTGLEQQTFHDDGRIPSTSSPQTDQDAFGSGTWANTSLKGTDDSYDIQWYQFAYCSGVGAPMTALSLFYECYTACSDATLQTPTFALQISGLPGSPTPGTSIGCWIVSIDLLGNTLNFTMNGDCDGSWDGTAALDYFGYAYMQVTPDPAAISGPILAGDPDGLLLDGPGGTGCCVGCGTVFWAGANVPGTNTEGSGLNTQDFFEIDDHLGGYAFSYNGCYWYGGYKATAPHSDIHMEIQGEANPGPTEPGTQYCNGHTLSGNPCPCANDNSGGGAGMAGCANGNYASGATLSGSGVASLGADTVLLTATNVEPLNSGMFFQGLNNLDGQGVFMGGVAGSPSGIRCAGGLVKRIKVASSNASGVAVSSPAVISVRSASLGDTITAGSIRRYQYWYRDNVDDPCNPGIPSSNTSNGYEITWLP